MDLSTITKSVLLFVLAGLFEIGGGWLVWQWFRSGRSVALGALGGLVLFLYGIVPTFQPAHFGRVYAAYGGVFVLLSLLWGWRIDGTAPGSRGCTRSGTRTGRWSSWAGHSSTLFAETGRTFTSWRRQWMLGMTSLRGCLGRQVGD